MSEQRVFVDNPTTNPVNVTGTVTTNPSGTQTVSGTVTANQGTAAATAGAWPTKIGNGAANVDVAPATPNGIGNALLTASGVLTSSTTITAGSGTANGTTIDYTCSRANTTLVVVASAGVSAGVVALEVSQDNTNFYRHTTTVTTTAPGVSQISITGVAFRYARGVIVTAITGGTVTCTVMTSG